MLASATAALMMLQGSCAAIAIARPEVADIPLSIIEKGAEYHVDYAAFKCLKQAITCPSHYKACVRKMLWNAHWH